MVKSNAIGDQDLWNSVCIPGKKKPVHYLMQIVKVKLTYELIISLTKRHMRTSCLRLFFSEIFSNDLYLLLILRVLFWGLCVCV